MIGVVIAIAAAGAFVQDAPSGVVRLNGGAPSTNSAIVEVELKLNRPESDGLEMTVSNIPGAAGAWTPFVESQTFELLPGDGEKQIGVRLRDKQGRESQLLLGRIVLDTTPPEPKVAAAERVDRGAVTLHSDVPDGVGMQWTESADAWGPWEPYVQPREIALSPGEGVKSLRVRYRDEAGNISVPAALKVEVSSTAPAERPGLGLREVRLLREPEGGPQLTFVLTMAASDVAEMELRLDASEPLPRQPFQPKTRLSLSRSGGAHRIRLKLWDRDGAERSAEIAFREADLSRDPAEYRAEDATPLEWWAAIKGGVVPQALHFEALTSRGQRKLEPATMAFARLELGYDFSEPFFGRLSFEFGGGSEVQVFTGGLDLGLHALTTELFSSTLDIDLDAGILLSQLEVLPSDFGSFDLGIGFRVGVGATLHLTDRLSLETSVDFRRITYACSDEVAQGDRSARMQSVGVFLGFSWRF